MNIDELWKKHSYFSHTLHEPVLDKAGFRAALEEFMPFCELCGRKHAPQTNGLCPIGKDAK